MTHVKVLLVIKNRGKIITKDDFLELLDNHSDPYNYEGPYGYDYLSPHETDEVFKGINANEYSFGTIIVENKEVWSKDWIEKPNMTKEEAIEKYIDKEDYCLICGGHL